MSYAITAALVRVVSEEDLETGVSSFRLGFKLPTGDIVYADATPDDLIRLRTYDASQAAATTARPVAPPTAQLIGSDEEDVATDYDHQFTGEPEEPTDADPVAWASLPESFLPDKVKVAMRAFVVSGKALPAMLAIPQVVQMRDAILSEYTASDWEQLGVAPDEEVSAAAEPPLGAIQWDEGSTHAPIQRPQRKVNNVDSSGNPIVKSRVTEVDPGEVVDMGDEDSTEQF